MLCWAASEALTAVAFFLSTIRTLKALNPGKGYGGGTNQPEYDILRVWTCLGLLTAAEQYLGWVLWYLPFYGAVKCVILGVAVTVPEVRVAPILFDRAVVPSMEYFHKYFEHSVKNSLLNHLLDVPIFFLELCIYPTDHAVEDENIKWSLAPPTFDEIEIHATTNATTTQRMDGVVCIENTLVVVPSVCNVETHCRGASSTPNPLEVVKNFINGPEGNDDTGKRTTFLQNLNPGDVQDNCVQQHMLRKDRLRNFHHCSSLGSLQTNITYHLLDVGTQAAQNGSHPHVLRTTPSRKQKVIRQGGQLTTVESLSRRPIGKLKLKKSDRKTGKGVPQPQTEKGGNGGQVPSSKKTRNDDGMTITGRRRHYTRSAACVGRRNEQEEKKSSLHTASNGRKNTKLLTHGQSGAVKRPPEISEHVSNNSKVAKLDTSKRNSNIQCLGVRRKGLKVVVKTELGKRQPVQSVSH